ncbi:MAG: hypothetical protein NAG76_10205 [Candidatus Pristimantibacillus lignocellulolyticus]|uniref:Uncharacterized protein n=1 Tax=Candidatus Pristimantibacillus lignocellulolyticus TaxID=2994561 RepID=A0A9J6ZK96_9BACL|nr:MAG: hypothetical protein NAG76_10205 [Candidatus Pristimantibacillus lignocellulolyticus]
MSMKEINHTNSKDVSIIKENKAKKSTNNNSSFNDSNEEFASEIGIEDNSSEGKPVSERSAWN